MNVIYSITNAVTEEQYIGSSGSMERRKLIHRSRLRAGNHPSRILQRAWDAYGEDNFRFDIIASVLDRGSLVSLERELIADRQPAYNTMRPVEGGWKYAPVVQLPRNIKRTTLTVRGRTQTLDEWATESGTRKGTIVSRLNRGWTPHDAVFGGLVPKDRAATHDCGGEQLTAAEIAARIGVTAKSVRRAMREGADLSDLGVRRYTVAGEVATIKGWATRLGLKESALRRLLDTRRCGPERVIEKLIAYLEKHPTPPWRWHQIACPRD